MGQSFNTFDLEASNENLYHASQWAVRSILYRLRQNNKSIWRAVQDKAKWDVSEDGSS